MVMIIVELWILHVSTLIFFDKLSVALVNLAFCQLYLSLFSFVKFRSAECKSRKECLKKQDGDYNSEILGHRRDQFNSLSHILYLIILLRSIIIVLFAQPIFVLTNVPKDELSILVKLANK